MRDLIHDGLKFVSYNRGTFLGLGILAGALVLASCAPYDGKTISSTTGELVDREGLRAEYIQKANELSDEWDAKTATKAELVLEYQAKIAKIDSELDSIEGEAEDLDLAFDADNESISIEITNRNAKIGQLAEVAQTVAPIPWLGPLLGIGLGGTVGGVAYDNWRKGRVIKSKKQEVETLKAAKA